MQAAILEARIFNSASTFVSLTFARSKNVLLFKINVIRAFETVQNNVYKDVKHRISNSHEFFDNLISTDTIYVLGHSISDIDIDYFRAVKQNANSNAKWVVSFYGDDDKEIKKINFNNLKFPIQILS